MQDFEVKERLREHLEYLCSFDKLSGEPEAYRAVEYILEVLEKSGISCHEEDFPAYLSNPVSSVLIADGEEFPCRPRSFSESTKGGNSGYGLISVPVTDAGGRRLKALRGEIDPEAENI